MSNSVRCNIYLSWDSFSWNSELLSWLILSIFNLSSSFSNRVFLESCDLRGLSTDLSYKGLRISCHLWVISWSISERLWSFLTWLAWKKTWVSFFNLVSFLRKQRVDFHSTSFVVPVLNKSLTYLCLSSWILYAGPGRSLSCNSSPCSNSIVCVLSKPGPTFQARNKVKEGSNNFLPFSIFGLAVKTLCWCI